MTFLEIWLLHSSLPAILGNIMCLILANIINTSSLQGDLLFAVSEERDLRLNIRNILNFSIHAKTMLPSSHETVKCIGLIATILAYESLSFCKHMKTMSLKVLRNIQFFLVHAIFSQSFVNPNFLHCVSVWASTFPSTLKPLQILQNKALRLIFNINNRSRVRYLYGSSGFFSVD